MYNDYKTHIVKKHESVSGIAEQHGTTEDELIKANPNIDLTLVKGGWFGSDKWVTHVKEGDTLKIPFHNEDKAKRGVKAITGKINVKPGEWEEYNVTEWYAGTPVEQRNEDHVKWGLYLLHTYRPPEKVLEKETGHFRFMQKAVGQKFRVVGYMYEPELDNHSGIIVKVTPTEKREIQKISLKDAQFKPISGPLSYGQKINVYVTTIGMAGEYIYLSLWEDDAKGGGHNKQNEANHNLVAEAKVRVSKKGMASYTFLLKPDFAKMANAYSSKGEKSEGSTHEYYVTAYADDHQEIAASNNVNVNNPEHQRATLEARRQSRQEVRQKKTKEHLAESKAPKKNETIPPFKKRVPVKYKKPTYEPAPTAPKPVPAAPKPKPGDKPEVTDVLIRDTKGRPITGTFKDKKIRVYIFSTGLKDKKVKMTLYEDDVFNQPVLETHIDISGNKHIVEIDIAAIPKSMGDDFFEGDEQELFVTIEVLGVKGIIESKTIDVDVKSFKPDKPDGTSVVTLGEIAVNKNVEEKVCVCQQYDLVWGGHSNVSCEFRKKVVAISKRQNFDPNHLMAVMYVESARTFSPSKIELKIVGYRKNGKPKYDYVILTKEEVLKLSENFSGAVGLIQFTPEAITGLNNKYSLSLTKRKLALMTQLEQLDYVEKYIAMWKETNKITTKLTLADLYLVVFAPSKMNGSDDNTILYAKESKYYDVNKSVDKDNNGISKKELAIRAYDSFSLGLANKESEFECGNNTNSNIFDAKEIITYHIYSEGKIEKHTPKVIKEEYKKKYKYVFHKNGKEHILNIFNFKLTKEMNKENVAGKNNVELVDIREFKGYAKDDVKLKFLTLNTESERYYINPDCYAGLLGAMADSNIDFLGFNGFSNYEAKSTGGSSSHRNGEKGDLRYLSKNKKGEPTILQDAHFDVPNQNKFNDTLYKFYWGRLEKMYSEHFNYDGNKNYLLNHTKHMMKLGKKGYRHYHHLHLTGFDHSLIKTREE